MMTKVVINRAKLGKGFPSSILRAVVAIHIYIRSLSCMRMRFF